VPFGRPTYFYGANVRSGSKPDMARSNRDVRFAPESGHCGKHHSQQDVRHLPRPGQPEGGSEAVALGEASLAVDRVPGAINLPVAFGILRVGDGNVPAVLEAMRDVAPVLAVAEPFAEGWLEQVCSARYLVERHDVWLPEIIEHVAKLCVFGGAVGVGDLPKACVFGGGAFESKPDKSMPAR
jgi:hypothetical protein